MRRPSTPLQILSLPSLLSRLDILLCTRFKLPNLTFDRHVCILCVALKLVFAEDMHNKQQPLASLRLSPSFSRVLLSLVLLLYLSLLAAGRVLRRIVVLLPRTGTPPLQGHNSAIEEQHRPECGTTVCSRNQGARKKGEG